MFSIGELSKLTQLPVKTLRYYHEEGLLVPAFVDPDTGYRYYDESHVETARVIVYLRSLEFPLNEIRELLRAEGEVDLLTVLDGPRRRIMRRDCRTHERVVVVLGHTQQAGIADLVALLGVDCVGHWPEGRQFVLRRPSPHREATRRWGNPSCSWEGPVCMSAQAGNGPLIRCSVL